MTTFFSKDELKEEFISGKPTKEYWVTTIFSKLKEEFTSGKPTCKGILGYNYLFKMSVDEIPQDTGSQRVE